MCTGKYDAARKSRALPDIDAREQDGIAHEAGNAAARPDDAVCGETAALVAGAEPGWRRGQALGMDRPFLGHQIDRGFAFEHVHMGAPELVDRADVFPVV